MSFELHQFDDQTPDPSVRWNSWRTFRELVPHILDNNDLKVSIGIFVLSFAVYAFHCLVFGGNATAENISKMTQSSAGLIAQAIFAMAGLGIGGFAVAVSVSKPEVNVVLEAYYVKSRGFSQFVYIYGGMATLIILLLVMAGFSSLIFVISGEHSPVLFVQTKYAIPALSHLGFLLWAFLYGSVFFSLIFSMLITKTYVWNMFINFRSATRTLK